MADAQTLPFRDGAFDAVVAACCLNHLPDPVAGLAECRRVTRTDGLVLASTFPADADHPAKAIVDRALQQSGYQHPHWYANFKEHLARRTGNLDTLARAAQAAGLVDVEVERVAVDAGLDRPELAVEWRLNMPHTIRFVASLDPEAREALRSRATTELAARSDGLPASIALLILRAHVR